jgi:Leucine-rich repeat (LRR) protein
VAAVSRLFNLQLREFLAVMAGTLAGHLNVSTDSMIHRSGHGIRMEEELQRRLSARLSPQVEQQAIEPSVSSSDQDYTGYRVYAAFCRSVATAVRSVGGHGTYCCPPEPEIILSVQQMNFWELEMQKAQESSLKSAWDVVIKSEIGFAYRRDRRIEDLDQERPVPEIRSWMQNHTDLVQGVSALDFGYLIVHSVPLMRSAPLEIGNFTALQMLSFAQNRLHSTFPRILNHLPNLTVLSFNANHLSMISPGSFDRLTGLTTLNLGSNQLSSIPSQAFSGLVNLTSLDLSVNRLQTISPGQFSRLHRLTTLVLDLNQLRTLPPSREFSVQEMPSLTSLYLMNNPGLILSDELRDTLSRLQTFRVDRVARREDEVV